MHVKAAVLPRAYAGFMFRHILVPIDDSPLSLKAVTYAAKVAKASKGRISLLHVIPPFSTPMYSDSMILSPDLFSPEEYRKQTELFAQKLFAKAHKAILRGGRVTHHTITVNDDEPWRAIIRAAKARKCDLVVMASHGRRGLAAVVLGSQTTKVLTHSKIPVLVCR